MGRRYTEEEFKQKFWDRVEKTGDCWNWTARKDRLGYGQVRQNGKPALAHRVAYIILVGPIPDGLTLDHLCRNRACVNPKHLKPVTHRENVLRGESPSARNAMKTHCPNGHPLVPGNLVLGSVKRGGRECLTCRRAYQRGWERKARLKAVLLVCLFILISASPTRAATIVEIVLDDIGYPIDLQALPSLDLLAQRGTSFRSAMTPMPLCTPSRISLLTGLHPDTHGVYVNDIKLADLSDTIATRLQAQGFRTAIVGKLGNKIEGLIRPPGWDKYQILTKHSDLGADAQTQWVANRSADFLRDCKTDGADCFLYSAPVAPHGPLDGPAECQGLPVAPKPLGVAMTDATWERRQRSLCGLNNLIDKLQRVAPDDTFFVVVGDNGFIIDDTWKSGKNELVLDALRVPLVIAGPGIVMSARNEIVTPMDVAATILDIAGADKSSIDGRSLLPLTKGVRNGNWLGSFTARIPEE